VRRGLWNILEYKKLIGDVTVDTDYKASSAWKAHINEILSAMEIVFTGKEKVRPQSLGFKGSCIAMSNAMETNKLLVPILGHDVYQMASCYPKTEPSDWFSIITSRKDGPDSDVTICETYAVYMYGDSTLRFSKPDGKRDDNWKQRVAQQMTKMKSGGPVEAIESNQSGTGMHERIKELRNHTARPRYSSNGKERTMNDRDVLIFTCNLNDLCGNTGWEIDGMNPGKLDAKRTEIVYEQMKKSLQIFVDEVVKQMYKGNLHVLILGGKASNWSADKKWDVIAERLRKDVDEHILGYWSADCFPRLLVVSGASLFDRLSHLPKCPWHFVNDAEGKAVMIVAQWMTAVSKLAIYLLAQPKGGNHLYKEFIKRHPRPQLGEEVGITLMPHAIADPNEYFPLWTHLHVARQYEQQTVIPGLPMSGLTARPGGPRSRLDTKPFWNVDVTKTYSIESVTPSELVTIDFTNFVNQNGGDSCFSRCKQPNVYFLKRVNEVPWIPGMVPDRENGAKEPPPGFPTICKSNTMRHNIFNYRALRWTNKGAARVHLPANVLDYEDDEHGRIWREAEMGAAAARAQTTAGSDLAFIPSAPTPATHILNEARDMNTIIKDGIVKNSDVHLGQPEAYRLGVYREDEGIFVEKLGHHRTLRVDGKTWLSPGADRSWARYSQTNMPPGKTDADRENGDRVESEIVTHTKASRKIWLLSKYQTAEIPYPSWDLFWPLLMKQLSELRNRMSMNPSSTLADCLDWKNSTWTNFPDHGGMVKISIPLVGRARFKEWARHNEWKEFCHFTPMSCLASVLECGILLPSKAFFTSQDGTLLPTRVASGGREPSPNREPEYDPSPQVHCCQWTPGPDSRLKYATFSEHFNDNNWVAAEVRVVSSSEHDGGLYPSESAEPGSGHFVGGNMDEVVIHDRFLDWLQVSYTREGISHIRAEEIPGSRE